jgi:ATP-dependent Clp protease ATP-binding subunit ClpA
MFNEKWSARHITDSAQRILEQVPSRATDRGLHVVDQSSINLLVLWSLLLWERKVGRVALEKVGIDPFELARSIDHLLTEKADEHPVAFDPQRRILFLVKTGAAYHRWDFEAVVEPLLQYAEHEALELGHNYVGSEHLVLAMARGFDPQLLALLQQNGVSHERLREMVVKLLHG